jgi:hypothetical protein
MMRCERQSGITSSSAATQTFTVAVRGSFAASGTAPNTSVDRLTSGAADGWDTDVTSPGWAAGAGLVAGGPAAWATPGSKLAAVAIGGAGSAGGGTTSGGGECRPTSPCGASAAGGAALGTFDGTLDEGCRAGESPVLLPFAAGATSGGGTFLGDCFPAAAGAASAVAAGIRAGDFFACAAAGGSLAWAFAVGDFFACAAAGGSLAWAFAVGDFFACAAEGADGSGELLAAALGDVFPLAVGEAEGDLPGFAVGLAFSGVVVFAVVDLVGSDDGDGCLVALAGAFGGNFFGAALSI